MLACRNCKIELSAISGCAICNPIRKHLIVVDENDDDKPSLAATGNEVVNALRYQLRVVRKSLGESRGEDEAAEKRLVQLANTLAKVLESSRKIQADGVDAIEAMSFAEKAELFITWIQELTPGYRLALRSKWDEWEKVISEPVKDLKELSDAS
jgi:hypothetical protein